MGSDKSYQGKDEMKEYTALAIASVIMTLAIDRAAGAGVFRRKEFYLFLLAMAFFKFLVNGFLTGRQIVLYNPEFFSGFRLGSIPVEDFLFGFSMVSLTIIFWESFKKRGAA